MIVLHQIKNTIQTEIMKELLNNTAKNIYIHIPFCVKKCSYCSFISYTNLQSYEDAYIDTLCKEAQAFSLNNIIETIYLGGGTPNLLKPESIKKLTEALNKKFNISENVEFTMEFNPKVSDLKYVKEVKALGINRISLGAQSFDDTILKTLGRIHNSKDTLNFIDILDTAGIPNYSLDLMYGIFGQDITSLENDINTILKINPKHVSTYGLKIEKGTPFEKLPKANLPDEDLCAGMYLLICEKLKNAGYLHYEISNFSKSGYNSKHNMAYWKNKEYFGFGTAAHGYLNNIRYKNPNNTDEYISDYMHKEILSRNTKEDILEEEIFLGLRTSDGINFEEIKDKFGTDLYTSHKDFIDELVNSGHGNITGNNFSLTEKGFLISNYILGKLI